MMSKVAWMTSPQGPGGRWNVSTYILPTFEYIAEGSLFQFGSDVFISDISFQKFQQSASWTIIVMMMMMMMMMMLTKATMTIIMLNIMVDTDEPHDSHMRDFSQSRLVLHEGDISHRLGSSTILDSIFG